MEYRLRNSADTLGCRLRAEKDFRFCGEMPRDYEPETVAYAACRLIRHSVPVKDRLVREAVRRVFSHWRCVFDTPHIAFS